MPNSPAQIGDVAQSSGTAVAPTTAPPQLPEPSDGNKEPAPSSDSPVQEQALESHEVIELQTFSERKVWIEDKIKFLEQLPPIEVFAGLEAVRTSAEYVPGVPTPSELKQWIAEHDAIEKETEIFDRGELTKLRQLTKAATQRNLSPADTDVIELTLTTIYELDKLLHLLRDRSENLELLAIRLTWEESRIAAWIDRRAILEDVRAFLDTRVRWTPSVYENTAIRGDETPSLVRRSSIASLASANSEASINHAGFSRGARFKLAELLSHDAAQFTGRITSLRHGKITAAGKILDKLIDHSRKPVPEELLDEQDKLEEQGITDMENLGKFVLDMVMQWRKADEIYVETMKDKTTAQNLFEEIETAKLHHPTTRQSTSFVSRADALTKRLAFRGDPLSSASNFLSPEHPLFSDQDEHNQKLALLLSSEISDTSATVRKVDIAAKAYRTVFEAVRRVEDSTLTAKDLSSAFITILEQLNGGISAEGDGSPPDLISLTCLEPNCHSAFLMVFPSILQQFAQTAESSTQILRRSASELLGLDQLGISEEFLNDARSAFQELESLQNQARAACGDMEARCALLSRARQLNAAMQRITVSSEDLRNKLSAAINRQMWQRVSGASTVQPRPSPSGTTHAELTKEFTLIASQMNQDISAPLPLLCEILDDPIKLRLLQQSLEVQRLIQENKGRMDLLDLVQRQADAMMTLYGEFSNLQLGMQDMENQIDAQTQALLDGVLLNGSIPGVDAELQDNLEAMQDKVAHFVNNLADRVVFVGQGDRPASSSPVTHESPPLSNNLEFDLPRLDAVVRADSNLFAMTLCKRVEDLPRRLSRFHVARIAKDIDATLLSATTHLGKLGEELQSAKIAFSEIEYKMEDLLFPLDKLLQDVEKAASGPKTGLKRSLSHIRNLLQEMETLFKANDASERDAMYISRYRAVEEATILHKNWEQGLSDFLAEVRRKQATEIERLELFRIDQEQQLERDRIAAEEAERVRRDQERLERKIQEKMEQQKIVAALQQQAEEDELAAETGRFERERQSQWSEGQGVANDGYTPGERTKDNEEDEKLGTTKEGTSERALEFQHTKGEKNQRLEAEPNAQQQQLYAEVDLDPAMESFLPEKDRPATATSIEQALETQVQQLEHTTSGGGLNPIATCGAQQNRFKHGQLASEENLDDEYSMGRCRSSEPFIENVDAHIPAGVPQRPLRAVSSTHTVESIQGVRDTGPLVGRPMKQQHQARKEPRRKQSPELHRKPKMEGAAVTPTSASESKTRNSFREDVFSLQATSIEGTPKTKEIRDLQTQILAFRKRIRSMNINEVATPKKSSAPLPDMNQCKKLARELSKISSGVSLLPQSTTDPAVDVELRSLRAEIESSTDLMKKVEILAFLGEDIQKCDTAISDLLEHIDSYPAWPKGVLSPSHTPLLHTTPEEQLTARLSFTRGTIENMTSRVSTVSSDSRAITERERIFQTWSELDDMGQDLLSSRKSRPTSAVSSRNNSGRNSSTSMINVSSFASKKVGTYSNLSTSPVVTQQRLLVPRHPTPRRAISGGSTESQSRPVSQLSGSSSRAVSGPLGTTSYGSTFASRQRNLSNSYSTPNGTPSAAPARTRAQTTQHSRVASPTESEASSLSRPVRSHSRSSTSMSTWSRAPRHSLSSIAPGIKTQTPKKKTAITRKTYIADPKNKLDVAVGDVVNRLPVGINIEGVSETWKDQSGKYWIGNQDPKLCFCRILRSQTVMVRVGGGWSELSKFIKDHFADSFRLLPESPPRFGAPEEKWISSTTLLDASADIDQHPVPPRTPEPAMPYVPSFSLSTPSGKSPRSVHSASNSPSTKGSPLTPLQFLRRVDVDSILRPATPSKPSTARPQNAITHNHTQARNSIWRP